MNLALGITLLVIGAILCWGIWGTIADIGKPRTPLTPQVVAAMVVVLMFMVTVMFTAAIVLIR